MARGGVRKGAGRKALQGKKVRIIVTEDLREQLKALEGVTMDEKIKKLLEVKKMTYIEKLNCIAIALGQKTWKEISSELPEADGSFDWHALRDNSFIEFEQNFKDYLEVENDI